MRKNLFILIALFAFVGCSEDEELVQPTTTGMSIEQKEFNADPSGDVIRVILKNTNTKPEYEISEEAKGWVELSSWGGIGAGNSGEYTFIYKVSANDGYETSRSASIRFTSGEASDVVYIYQDGGSPFAFVQGKQLTINADGGVLAITPKESFKPENLKDASDSWVTFNKTAVTAEDGVTKQILFTVSPNETGADRSTTISYVDETGKEDSFTILQGCRIVTSSKEVVISEAKVSSMKLAINSAIGTDKISVNKNVDWLTADTEGKLSIQDLPEELDERVGIIKYTNMLNMISEEVKITQIRSARILGDGKELKTLSLIPNYPYQLEAQTSVLTQDEPLKCTSSKATVATVSSDGLITPVKAGKATITLTAGSYKKTCSVTVGESKDLLPIRYEGSNKYDIATSSHEYDGKLFMENKSSYIVTVNSVAGSPYNKVTMPTETFECIFKKTYKGTADQAYTINWKMQVGITSTDFDITFKAGSFSY